MSNFRITRRSLIGGVTGITGLAVVSACSNDTGEPGRGENTSPTGDESTQTETVEVSYTFPGGANNLADAGIVSAALNEMAAAKGRSYKIRLDPVDWSTFGERVPLDLNTGNPMDAVWTASWANQFHPHVASGNFQPLTELLNGPAQGLRDAIPEQRWQAATVDGEIMAIPTQAGVGTWGFLVDAAVAEELGFDPESITTYPELTPFLTEAHAAHPDKVTLYSDGNGAGIPFNEEHFGWDTSLGSMGLVVSIDDETCRFFNYFDTDEAREYMDLAHQWRQAGFFESSPPVVEDAEVGWSAGKYIARMNQTGSPQPIPVVVKDLVRTHFLSTGSIISSLNAVARVSKHPEALLQFFEDMHTDVEMYNVLCQGIEGTHWEWEDESIKLVKFPDGVTAENATWNPNSDWIFANPWNAYYRDRADAERDRWTQEKELVDSAQASVIMGFNFNSEPVQTEVATVTAVVSERRTQNFLGLVDPATAATETVERLKNAGIDKVMEEAQRQVDEWLESK